MHEAYSLTGNECALYHYLLKRSNSSNWRNPIEVMNSVAIEYLNLKSFRDVQASRDKLAQAGLIQFKTTNGSKFVTYSLFDAETKTFAPIAKVTAKVLAKVSAEVLTEVPTQVGVSLLLDNKQKPKPKELEQLQHGLFFNQFFSEQAEYDREQICVQIREKEIKREWCEIFNAHLHTERIEHKDYHSWIKHLRSWLPKKLAELKKGEQVQQQQKHNRHVYT